MSADVASHAGVTEADLTPHETVSGRKFLRRLFSQPLAVAAMAFLLLLVVCALLASVIAPYGENQQDLTNTFLGPTADHWLGTDALGRDTLSRLVYGSQFTLQAAFQSVLLAAVVGVPLGLFVGYRAGVVDRVIMRLVDVGDSLPGMLLAFAVIAVLGPGLTNAMIAVSLIFVTNYVRLTRALVLEERERLYVEGARVSGLRTSNILLRQILPNIATPLIVQSAIFAGRAILIAAALSFLGLGLNASEASWGNMLSGATTNAAIQPLLPWPPGLAITLTVLAFNLLGDGMRDALGAERALQKTADRRITRRVRAYWDRRGAAPTTSPRPATTTDEAVLTVTDLTIQFPGGPGETITVVESATFSLRAGETLGLVGESGSGKTMTSLGLMGLVPSPGRVSAGSVNLGGTELLDLDPRGWRSVRGSEIAMVFQDPLVALSPVHTIGQQLTQAIRNHHDLTRAQARARAVELLELVGVPRAAGRLKDYPHQFSGGMAQRVVIAMALAGEPKVLVADEPTTALDVTVQAQVLDLLAELQELLGMAVLLITHDLGIIADSCDRALVMYAGQVVEEATTDELFRRPKHPYTRALLDAMPSTARPGLLPTIPGRVPPASDWPHGCRFHPRCAYAEAACVTTPVPLEEGVRCVRVAELDLTFAPQIKTLTPADTSDEGRP